MVDPIKPRRMPVYGTPKSKTTGLGSKVADTNPEFRPRTTPKKTALGSKVPTGGLTTPKSKTTGLGSKVAATNPDFQPKPKTTNLGSKVPGGGFQPKMKTRAKAKAKPKAKVRVVTKKVTMKARVKAPTMKLPAARGQIGGGSSARKVK